MLPQISKSLVPSFYCYLSAFLSLHYHNTYDLPQLALDWHADSHMWVVGTIRIGMRLYSSLKRNFCNLYNSRTFFVFSTSSIIANLAITSGCRKRNKILRKQSVGFAVFNYSIPYVSNDQYCSVRVIKFNLKIFMFIWCYFSKIHVLKKRFFSL